MSETQTPKAQNDQIEQLFQAGAHFAYSKSRRHPSMKPYIYGAKNQVEIFNLESTIEKLEAAADFVQSLGKERKQILFVTGKKEAEQVIRVAADSIDQPYVAGRWIGGTLTNFSQIRARVDRLEDLLEKREKGELSVYTKREQLELDREIEDLDETFGGLRPMKKLPAAVFVVDPRQESIAVAEARKMGISLVGLLNSDCNAHRIEYPVPGNDATLASIQYFTQKIAQAYQEGLNEAPTKKETEGEQSTTKNTPSE